MGKQAADDNKTDSPGTAKTHTELMEDLGKTVFGTENKELAVHLFNQTFLVAGSGFDDGMVAGAATLALVQGIAPRDDVERMLAAQMVGTHEAAMTCLRLANVQGQTFEGRDMSLRQGAKLMQLYQRQIEALDKHRGKGQQKITVEHVTVEAGGQAIVGHVHGGKVSGAAGDIPSTPVPRALSDESQADAIGGSLIDELADTKAPASRGRTR